MPSIRLAVTAGLILAFTASALEATPQFARRYDVGCGQCHSLPPKLNEFGEAFLAGGYEAPELSPRRTVPAALWISGRAESRPVTGGLRDEIGPFVNRVELISGGRLLRPWLSYFAEWRAVSQETRADGSLRDRSGRFEDLFVTAALPGGFDVTLGQFRQVGQVDVSRRLSLSEPLVLSAGLAGSGGDSARERSLRGFSPSGRSPALRVGLRRPLAGDRYWTTSVALPVPGELSIPLSSEAKREASNELELELKGVVVESFVRRGLTSFGGHVFYDDDERYLVHGLVTGSRERFHWAVMAGVARSGGVDRGRWSVEAEYLPSGRLGVGARLEAQAADGVEPALLPYVVWHLPRKLQRLTATFEQRLQQDRNASLIEVGLVF